MKIPMNRRSRMFVYMAGVLLAAFSFFAIAEEVPTPKAEVVASNLTAHEWGTFTTLHSPNGIGLAWYQSRPWPKVANETKVGELPGFVHGGNGLAFFKARANATARMETPVMYFYTDKKQKVDILVNYPGGQITEVFPAASVGYNHWKQLELIPAAEAGDLAKQLRVDPKRPDNHYYEAREVPEAALVRRVLPVDKNGKQKPDELEKFVFYRGTGSFATGLNIRLGTGGQFTIKHYNGEFGIDHAWVLESSADAIRWKKLPAFSAYDPKAKVASTKVKLSPGDGGNSREDSIAKLKASMVAALNDAGLTSAEASAMVATWDKQWYEEPGQRIFSIPPQGLIDKVLPLKITPKPAETVRVFVHRAEILSPETQQRLDVAMAPGVDPQEARKTIRDAQLGRFVYGAIEAVSASVGARTTAEYRARAFKAIAAPADTKTAAAAK
jgi:hypothetical protein